MLNRPALALGTLCALVCAAQAEDRSEGLKAPARLTVGLADQLLGQLSPDGKQLYFISTVRTSSEVAYQDPPGGRPKVLFDENADVTWPRVSPDGKRLAYVSLGEHATGQLCVRELPKGEPRRCLEAPVGALQAEWMSRDRLGMVVRDTIQGDLRLLEVSVGATLTAKPLPQKNLVSPAFSPDGRWMVYVPIARYSRDIGPGFAASASEHLEAVRVDRPGEPEPLKLDAPGVTAQPTFSKDGKWLYFVQFIHDSDHDGKVDALDHGVLFRVAFPSADDGAVQKAQAAVPEQLTDGSWNCQYPSVGREALVASCSQKDNVDVHELPLEGVIPQGWNADRAKEEVELATAPEQQLLLYHRVLESEPSLSSRHRAMVRMVRIHLELEDFVAARFYAHRVGELEDPATTGVGRPLQALVKLREGRNARERGRVLTPWTTLLRETKELLEPQPNDSSAATSLGHIVESEGLQLAGQYPASRAALEATEIDSKTPRAVLELYHDRADTLFRTLDDEPGLQASLRKLVAASRKPEVQLDYARALARSLIRGKPYDEKLAILAKELDATPPTAELHFALELQGALATIRGPESPGATAALRALMGAQTRPDRKKAILLEASERASDLGAAQVLEDLARDAVKDIPEGSSDRTRVEHLFSDVVMNQAYDHRAKAEYAEAKEDFEAVARQTRSFEALVGWLDLRLKGGESGPALVAALEKDSTLLPYMRAFGQAWVLVRGLGELDKKGQLEVRAKAVALIKSAWPKLKQHRLGQALSGSLRHEEYLDTQDLAIAERANASYLTALRLWGTPRQTAMLLGEAGLLQLDVGNFRLALAQLDEREKYPYIDNGSGLAVQLARARALLHVGRMNDAVETVEEAVVMTTKAPKLAQYHLLALDRAALTTLAAGKYARSLALYDEELPKLSGRNALVAKLARAAAALGATQPQRSLDDLSAFDAAIADEQQMALLKLPHQTLERSQRAYQLIAAGLRANAHQALEQREQATAALERQQALLLASFADSDRDDDLRALVLCEARLAQLALPQRQPGWAAKAVEHADTYTTRTGAPVTAEQTSALWLQASLFAQRQERLPPALVARLKKSLGDLSAVSDPMWRIYRRWFEVYLALDEVTPSGASPAPAPVPAPK